VELERAIERKLRYCEKEGHQLSGGQEDIGALAKSVGEVARAGADDGGLLGHASLVAHAQRAARHFRAGAGGPECSVVA